MNKRHLLYFLFSLSLSVSFAQGEKRLALVIGNSKYNNSQFDELKNCGNDAEDIASKLKSLGFTVIGPKKDTSKQELKDAISDFTSKAGFYDVVLFYYSGHGLQHNGCNYLVPTDMPRISSVNDLEDPRNGLYFVQSLLRDIEDSGCKLGMIVLDACRNNNLPGARGDNRRKGLAKMPQSTNTIVAYATQAGSTADDGFGRNSPYTKVFLKMLDKQDWDIFKFFNQVGVQVKKETRGGQIPDWTAAPIEYPFIFNRRAVEREKSITFNLSPSNATIKFGNTTYKNGQSVSLAMGSTYSFTAEADGYQAQSNKMTISESTPSILTISLKKITPELQKKKIQFYLQPSHAVIKFGNTTCKSGQSLIFQQGSTYSYAVEAEGFQSISGKLIVDETTQDQMAFSLPVISAASVYVTSNTSASIYLDGEYIGITPIKVTTTIGKHEMKLTADRYYNKEFTLDIAESNNPRYIYLEKMQPWFWDSDKYEAIMVNYHFSPVYPITISGMYQFDDYPFAVGLMFGSSTGFYRGWIPKTFTINGQQIYKYSKGLLNYSELYDPNIEAVKHDSELILLANIGCHICNGIMLELGIGAAHHVNKYYMDNAYYKLEQNSVIGNTNIKTSIYDQTFFSQWYKGENGMWS